MPRKGASITSRWGEVAYMRLTPPLVIDGSLLSPSDNPSCLFPHLCDLTFRSPCP